MYNRCWGYKRVLNILDDDGVSTRGNKRLGARGSDMEGSNASTRVTARQQARQNNQEMARSQTYNRLVKGGICWGEG